MPTYHHSCLYCKSKCEIDYSMKYVGEEDKMPQSLKDQISCNKKTCKNKSSKKMSFDFIYGFWPRIPFAAHIANVSGGTTSSNDSILLKKKQKQRSLRSRTHFKNEVLPKLGRDEKRHFTKKLSHIKGDHEKM